MGPIVTAVTLPSMSTSVIVGPDEGFMECLSELQTRRAFLKSQGKILQQNPNALENTDSLSLNELTVEEIKRKQNHLRVMEKKLKRVLSHLDLIKNQRDSRIFGRTIDTYAFDVIKGVKAGQPNADSFYAEAFNDQIYFGVADGIGWGIPSRRAAQSALLGFMMSLYEFTLKRRGSSLDTVTLAQTCFSAIELAHLSVHAVTEAKTTFSGGILVRLELFDDSSDPMSSISSTIESDSESDSESNSTVGRNPRWMFVGISVGDSLIYRYSASTHEVMELTVSDRTGGVRDAGGCLGGKEPDLRNLTYHCCLAEEGDLFIAVSDGVHDNLDPEVLKCPLSESGFEIPDGVEDWEDLNTIEKNEKKRRFKEEKLLEIIESVNEVSPRAVTDAIISEIEEITRAQRKGYEEGSRLQRDWDKMEETE